MKNKKRILSIGWLYPDLMSTYGDRGNVICLQKRCEWRGIGVEVKEISLGTDVKELKKCDFLFMGGAQDRQQKIASEDLKKKAKTLQEMIESGIPGLYICGAYQFLGHYYRPAEGEDIPGLGIFDLHTVHPGVEKPRCIGNVVVKIPTPYTLHTTPYLIGFENHGGRTYLGKKVEPLGEVAVGYGNNGQDKTEGAVYKNSFGSYLHGPILPKNHHFADLLIKLALEKKYGSVELKELDDSLEWQAYNFMVKRLGISSK